MPRTARAAVGGMIHHDLNRGNRREAVFHKPADFDAFVAAMNDAQRRVSVDLFGIIAITARPGTCGRDDSRRFRCRTTITWPPCCGTSSVIPYVPNVWLEPSIGNGRACPAGCPLMTRCSGMAGRRRVMRRGGSVSTNRSRAATCSDCVIRCCVVGRSATTTGRALPPRLWA